MKNNNLALGILGGLAVGALLGVLFAPAKGTETRKKIASKGNDLKDMLAEHSEKLTDKITQTISDLKTESQHFINNTTNAVQDEVGNFDHLVEINKVK